MTPPADPNAIIDAMAPLLGLEVAEEDRASVAFHLATAARLDALVEAVAIPDAEEPAPVFTPAPVGEDAA
ncbi:DUF4089 domain-containing protein [Salinarimonas sp.]|uniref:DUF4089 domain-containing protein n=1 Tax=Salinarimonas sp. TaxID=2766526 RepID=UPI0032D9309A